MTTTATVTTTLTREVSLTIDGREAKFPIMLDADDASILAAAQEVARTDFGHTDNLSGFVVDRASPSLVIVRPKVPFGA